MVDILNHLAAIIFRVVLPTPSHPTLSLPRSLSLYIYVAFPLSLSLSIWISRAEERGGMVDIINYLAAITLHVFIPTPQFLIH